jgi:hypothetical protein
MRGDSEIVRTFAFQRSTCAGAEATPAAAVSVRSQSLLGDALSCRLLSLKYIPLGIDSLRFVLNGVRHSHPNLLGLLEYVRVLSVC